MRGHRHAPAAPCPRERPGTHCTGGWVGLRTGLDWCGKSRPTGIRSPDRPARRQSLYRLHYPAHIGAIYFIKTTSKFHTIQGWQEVSFFMTSHNSSVTPEPHYYLALSNVIQVFVCKGQNWISCYEIIRRHHTTPGLPGDRDL